MSRQNKQAKKLALAAEFQALHRAGDRGPAKTVPKRHAGRSRNSEARAAALAEIRSRIAATVRARFGKSAVVTPW